MRIARILHNQRRLVEVCGLRLLLVLLRSSTFVKSLYSRRSTIDSNTTVNDTEVEEERKKERQKDDRIGERNTSAARYIDRRLFDSNVTGTYLICGVQ